MENTSLMPVYGKVYLITNTVNGKKYVGQTVRSLAARFRSHFNQAKHHKTGRQTPIKSTLLKYPKGSFEMTLLCSCYCKEELDLMEDWYIALFDTMNPKIGYNIKRGGAHGKHSEEVKRHGSLIRKGKKFPPEWRQHLKEAAARSTYVRIGRHPDEFTRKKMGDSHRGNKSYKFRHDLSTDEIVKLYSEGASSPEISNKLLVGVSTILDRLRKAGVEIRTTDEYPSPRFKNEVDTNELVRLYASGINTTQLASMFPLSKASIGNRIKKTGFKMRPTGGDKQAHPERYTLSN